GHILYTSIVWRQRAVVDLISDHAAGRNRDANGIVAARRESVEAISPVCSGRSGQRVFAAILIGDFQCNRSSDNADFSDDLHAVAIAVTPDAVANGPAANDNAL